MQQSSTGEWYFSIDKQILRQGPVINTSCKAIVSTRECFKRTVVLRPVYLFVNSCQLPWRRRGKTHRSLVVRGHFGMISAYFEASFDLLVRRKRRFWYDGTLRGTLAQSAILRHGRPVITKGADRLSGVNVAPAFRLWRSDLLGRRNAFWSVKKIKINEKKGCKNICTYVDCCWGGVVV